CHSPYFILFSFSDTAPTEIYTLSLHDALPICSRQAVRSGKASTHTNSRCRPLEECRPMRSLRCDAGAIPGDRSRVISPPWDAQRSEEHTSELQSRENLVCRLLLEKKNDKNTIR